MTLALLPIFLANAEAYNPTWPELRSDEKWVIQDTVRTEIGTVTVSKKMIDNFPCFEGVSIYPEELDIKLMIDIVSDAESAMDWSSADVTQAKTLGRSNAQVDYWQYLSVPVFSDRMWFLRGYYETNGDVSSFRWERLDQGGEHRQFYEEMIKQYPHAEVTPINLGAWLLSVSDNTTTIRYRICSHPGGSVPAMLQSVATESTLPNNLRDLVFETKRRMAE